MANQKSVPEHSHEHTHDRDELLHTIEQSIRRKLEKELEESGVVTTITIGGPQYRGYDGFGVWVPRSWGENARVAVVLLEKGVVR